MSSECFRLACPLRFVAKRGPTIAANGSNHPFSSNALSGELYMIKVVAVVVLIISWLIAAKEALDLGWLQTGVIVLLGWMAQFAITTVITALALGPLELSIAALR